jgi:L-cystine transport system substrate-binding protein
MSKLKRFLLLLGVALLLLLGATLLGSARRQPDTSWRVVQASGVLRVGMDASYPPFSDLRSGQPKGLEVDLAEALAARLGLRAQIVPLGIDGLYDSLRTGGVDVLISALPKDPARLDEVLYLREYVDAGLFIVASAPGYQTMTDLVGKVVGAEYGSLGDETARTWLPKQNFSLQHFIDPDAALEALAGGQLDAVLIDQISALLYRRAHPQVPLYFSARPLLVDPYAPVVSAQKLALAMEINAAMEGLLQEGVIAEIVARWL